LALSAKPPFGRRVRRAPMRPAPPRMRRTLRSWIN
jgi:hypothetical protein